MTDEERDAGEGTLLEKGFPPSHPHPPKTVILAPLGRRGGAVPYEVRKLAEDDPLWRFVEEHFPRSVRYLRDPKDDGDYHFFIALDEAGAYLGGSVIDIGAIDYGPLKGRMEGFLEDIEVEEAFRRRGIGTALLRAALDFAWQRGARHVRWTVSCGNRVGIVFYDSLGLTMLPDQDEQNPDDKYYLVVAGNPMVEGSRLRSG